MGGVFEGEFGVGEGVVGGWLHQTVDEDTYGTFGIGRFGEGDFSGKVHAVEDEDRRIGEGDALLRGHDLAAGEGEADNGLGGGACAGGVGGVDTCDRQGSLANLDGGAFFSDGRDILATLGAAASDRLECAAHSVAYGFGNTCVGGGCCGQGVGQGRPVVFGVGRNNAVDLFKFEFLHSLLLFLMGLMGNMGLMGFAFRCNGVATYLTIH